MSYSTVRFVKEDSTFQPSFRSGNGYRACYEITTPHGVYTFTVVRSEEDQMSDPMPGFLYLKERYLSTLANII